MNFSRAHTLFVALAFSAWILPLGNFIKPAEEYRTCGGKRAFHQCSVMQGKVRTESSPIAYSSASGTESQPKNAPCSPGFDSILATAMPLAQNTKFLASSVRPFYLDPSQAPLAPPPKFSI